VSELRTSSFKMFENAPYELPDPGTLIGAFTVGLKEQEKILGPVFSTRLIMYTLKFVTQRIKEKPPEDIKNLDQLVGYLVSISDKYPTPYCAIMYAQYKTENDLQGRAGAVTRVGEMGFHRTFGKDSSGKERNIDLDNVISNLHQTAIAIKLSPKEFGYRKNEDGSVDFLLPNCYFKDGCQQAFNEGLLKRSGGKIYCNLGSSLSQYLKMVTSCEWDFECLEYDKPHCITRFSMV